MNRRAATLGAAPLARVVYQHMPHHFGSDGEEMRPILPFDLMIGQQPEKCLLHQRRGLHAVVFALASQVTPRDLIQLPLNQGQQSVQGGAVSLPPTDQESGDIFCRGLHASVGKHIRKKPQAVMVARWPEWRFYQ
jgi:hypothetical protein